MIISSVCLLAGILMLAALVVGFFRSARGTPSLSEPRCAKCNYDLRGFTGTVPTRCSECGADLTLANAIRWGTYQRNFKALIWVALALGLAVLIPLGLLGVRMGSPRPVTWKSGSGPGTPGFAARTNAVVIASLSTSANTPWDWQELERRLAAGKLSSAEVTQAIDQLIVFEKTQAGDQPLTWCEHFVQNADAAGDIPDEQYTRLARAFYKRCKVVLPRSIRSGSTVQIRVNAGGPWMLPGSEFVYALRQAEINGQLLSLTTTRLQNGRADNRKNPADLNYFSAKSPWDIDCNAQIGLSPGKYVINFTIDAAVLHEKTSPLAIDNLPGQAGNWPAGRAAWSDVVSIPVTVLGANQSTISLVTDSQLDPGATGAAQVKSIKLNPQRRRRSGHH